MILLMPPECRTVYEPSFTWWFPAAGLGIAVMALIIGRFMGGSRRVFTFAIAGLGLVWALGAAATVYGFHAEARAAAKSPNTPVVQGVVEDFRPAPYEGHQDESFAVSGVRFAYSDFVITGGFRQSSSHGGPIRQGLLVRIRYLPSGSTDLEGRPTNLIVRLDTCP
jgi:hypothetical protein